MSVVEVQNHDDQVITSIACNARRLILQGKVSAKRKANLRRLVDEYSILRKEEGRDHNQAVAEAIKRSKCCDEVRNVFRRIVNDAITITARAAR